MSSWQSVDWGRSGRTDRFEFVTVDPFTLAELETFDAIHGQSSLTFDYLSDTQVQGTFDIGPGDYLGDGLHHRMVRVYDTIEVDGMRYRQPLATMFVSNASNDMIYGRSNRHLTCYGPMYRYTEDYLPQDFTRAPGDNCVDAIREIVELTGGKLLVDEGVDYTRKHTVQVFFPIGHNVAEMLQIYSGWIGCEVWGDAEGFIRLSPYRAYADRAPVYTFTDGANCIYKAGIQWETNRDEPINRVVAYFSREKKQDDPSKDNYDPYPLADSATVELPQGTRMSFEVCGRYRTEVLQVTEPCNHDDLVAQAQRALDEGSGSYLDIIIEHAGIPFLKTGDCVRYINGLEGIDDYYVITQMRISSLSPMLMTQSKLRRARA